MSKYILLKDSRDNVKDLFNSVEDYVNEDNSVVFAHTTSRQFNLIKSNDDLAIVHFRADANDFVNQAFAYQILHVKDLSDCMDKHGNVFVASFNIPSSLSDNDLINLIVVAYKAPDGTIRSYKTDEPVTDEEVTNTVMFIGGEKLKGMPVYPLILNNTFIVNKCPRTFETGDFVFDSLYPGRLVKDYVFNYLSAEDKGVETVIGKYLVFANESEVSFSVFTPKVQQIMTDNKMSLADIKSDIIINTNIPYKLSVAKGTITLDLVSKSAKTNSYFRIHYQLGEFWDQFANEKQRMWYNYMIYKM